LTRSRSARSSGALTSILGCSTRGLRLFPEIECEEEDEAAGKGKSPLR
jgi:hypothetical protein